jgi:superfamily II DNA helicase RecQ
MKIRVITLPLGEDGTFDDEPLQVLLHERRALAVSEHFFVYEGRPTLALVVQYREQGSQEVARAGQPASRRDERGAPEVAPEERVRFEALRRWRNERARKDGKPAYVLFTNEHLLQIVRTRPATPSALQAIDGIGEARVRDYADEVLAVLKAVPEAALPPVPPPKEPSHGSEPADSAG